MVNHAPWRHNVPTAARASRKAMKGQFPWIQVVMGSFCISIPKFGGFVHSEHGESLSPALFA